MYSKKNWLTRKNSNFNELIRTELLNDFKFDGIEAIYGLNSQYDTAKFIDICKQHKLLITGGSDFHDFNISSHSNIGEISLDNKNIENLLKFIESK